MRNDGISKTTFELEGWSIHLYNIMKDELLEFINHLSHGGTFIRVPCPALLNDRPHLIINLWCFRESDVTMFNYLTDITIDVPPTPIGKPATQYLWFIEYTLDSASSSHSLHT